MSESVYECVDVYVCVCVCVFVYISSCSDVNANTYLDVLLRHARARTRKRYFVISILMYTRNFVFMLYIHMDAMPLMDAMRF